MTPTRHDLDDHDLRELSRRLHDLADRWEVPAPSERPDPAAPRRRLPAWLPDWVGAGAMVPVLAGLALVVLAIVASAWLADLGDTPDPVDDTPASSIILDLLGEVPAEVVGDSPIDVQLTDLATATRLAGMDRPTSDSSDDEYTAWLERLSGIESDPGTGDGVFAPFPTGASVTWSDVAPWEDELGWSILDVDRIVEVTAQSVLGRSFVPPFGLDGRFGVVTGPAGQGDFPADLEDLGDGVVQAGDDSSSLADSTPVRLQGSPLFLSRADGRLAYGSTEAMVRSWRDSTGSTLADDPDVAAAAAAVTTPDLTAARLERADFAWDPELDNPDIDPTELLPAPFDAIALGWSRDDQGLLVTVAYVHESAQDANRNAEELQRVWSSPGMPEGMASPDSLTIESVATDGRVVTVRIRPTTPESSYQPELYLNLRGLPFVHAGDGETAATSSSGTSIAPGLEPPQSAPEVVAKHPYQLPPGEPEVWAAWTDTQAGVDELWATFQIEADPPDLNGGAMVVAATGEGQNCPMTLTAVEVADGRVGLSFGVSLLDDSQLVPAPDGGVAILCKADFNPVVFAVEVSADATRPPLTVDYRHLDTPDDRKDTSIRITEPHTVSAESGREEATTPG